jgi:hypothetical protein
VPGKAAYLALESDPELEFEFMLAEKLARTVAELRASLSGAEWILWTRYYARRRQDEELAALKAK